VKHLRRVRWNSEDGLKITSRIVTVLGGGIAMTGLLRQALP
jgi:hypothetical protein